MARVTAAVIQMDSQDDPKANRSRALDLIATAVDRGAQLVVLPEVFVFMHELDRMRENTEPIPGPTSDALQEAARRHRIYLVGGSFLGTHTGPE